METSWPVASYFHAGTAWARHVMRELELVDRKDWRELYRRKSDDSLWRLDIEDKYQQRFLIRVESLDGWGEFDSRPLEEGLLLQSRGGLGTDKCICLGCSSPILLKSAFCLKHTYERGVRE